MRQFKIIDTSPNDQGLLVANFAMPIKIEPGCCINLDKFVAQIPQSRAGIQLPTQVFLITTNKSDSPTQITVPGKFYETITDLTETLTQLINNSFYPLNNVAPLDMGLKFDMFVNTDLINMNFVSVELKDVTDTLDLINCSSDPSGIIITESEAPFDGFSTVDILAGGGFACEFIFRPDIAAEGVFTIESGLVVDGVTDFQPNGDYIVIRQVLGVGGDPGIITIESTFGVGQTLVVNEAVFYPSGVQTARFVSIVQQDGFWNVVINEVDEGNVKGNFVEEYITNTPWNIKTTYNFYMTGVATGSPYEDKETNPGVGFVSVTANQNTGDENALTHTLTLDFYNTADGANANTLRQGLGLPNVVVLQPTVSTAGVFVAATKVDFSIIRGSLDLAIEILDFPIETYQVGASQYPLARIPTNGKRQPGARVNVLAYFTPLESVDNPEIYSYAQSSYQWLDLANKQPLEFTSLNFRVYVASTGQPLTANQISFNFLIKSQGEY
jgi:hypothetical protein